MVIRWRTTPTFGDFPFTGNNGFTYNLQDLVTLPYFGAPPSTSVNNEFTFQGESLTVCQNGAQSASSSFTARFVRGGLFFVQHLENSCQKCQY
jgi:hypothetical protein